MYKYENYQSKKVKKKPKTCGFKSSKLTFRFFFPTCMRFELNRFVHNILFNFSTIFSYFTVQKRQTSGIKVFGINVIQCTCIQVWELSPLPHHYIFIRTLTKASNCCSTTSQTILDLSPLVGEPPFTTFYREKYIQISFRHDIMHVQIILECGMGVYIFWLGVVKVSVWVPVFAIWNLFTHSV